MAIDKNKLMHFILRVLKLCLGTIRIYFSPHTITSYPVRNDVEVLCKTKSYSQNGPPPATLQECCTSFLTE